MLSRRCKAAVVYFLVYLHSLKVATANGFCHYQITWHVLATFMVSWSWEKYLVHSKRSYVICSMPEIPGYPGHVSQYISDHAFLTHNPPCWGSTIASTTAERAQARHSSLTYENVCVTNTDCGRCVSNRVKVQDAISGSGLVDLFQFLEETLLNLKGCKSSIQLSLNSTSWI